MPKPKPIEYWLQRVQALIVKHSTPVRTRGKYKGHSSTDSRVWVEELAKEVTSDIRRVSKGIAYDENMALASYLGTILFVWYAVVHRAKSYDPNRPVHLRRKALKRRNDLVNKVFSLVNDDRLMVGAFSSQLWNLPYGRGVKGGKFV